VIINKENSSMWWLICSLSLLALIIVWIHSVRGMAVRDRLNAAVDIVDTSNFEPAEGFEQARNEDPDLVGWIQAGNDSVMLFRSQHGVLVKEVVDVASNSFHPGLVVHYENGHAVRSDEGLLSDARHRKTAEELLRKSRLAMHRLHPQPMKDYDGFHV
jgi:hypothetical protein